MATMSTPINQLPTNISNEVIQENIHQLEDISIANVIDEMEKQVLHQQQNTHYEQPQFQQQQQHYSQQPQINITSERDVIHYPNNQSPTQYFPPQQQMFQQQHYSVPVQPSVKMMPESKNILLFGFIDMTYAQRAIIAAIVAAIIFYPFETGVFYERIPFLSNMYQHDRMIRTFILAVILYFLSFKINI